MNRSKFAIEIAKRYGMSLEKAYHYVCVVTDAMQIILIEGEELKFYGMGTFGVSTNSKGERIPEFRAGRKFINYLNAESKW